MCVNNLSKVALDSAVAGMNPRPPVASPTPNHWATEPSSTSAWQRGNRTLNLILAPIPNIILIHTRQCCCTVSTPFDCMCSHCLRPIAGFPTRFPRSHASVLFDTTRLVRNRSSSALALTIDSGRVASCRGKWNSGFYQTVAACRACRDGPRGIWAWCGYCHWITFLAGFRATKNKVTLLLLATQTHPWIANIRWSKK